MGRFHGNASVICRAIHSAVGYAVTLIQTSSRRASRTMTRIYSKLAKRTHGSASPPEQSNRKPLFPLCRPARIRASTPSNTGPATCPQPEPPRRKLDTMPVDWSAVIDERIASERELIATTIGAAIGDYVRDVRAEAKDELAAEVRKLWAIVTELQTTLKAFDRIEHASKAKAEPLDLPTLPRSRGLN